MPKITGKTISEHREKTRQQLFNALSTLLRNQSFDSLTMAQIAMTAQVGRTSIYNHFPDKDALLLAYILHETASYSQRLLTGLKDLTSPLEQLRLYIRAQLELKARYSFAPGPALSQVMDGSSAKELHAHARVIEEVLAKIINDAVAQKLIPPTDINATIPLIHACLSGWRLPNDRTGREAFIALTQNFVLRALGANVPAEEVEVLSHREATRQVFASSRIGSGSCPVAHGAPRV